MKVIRPNWPAPEGIVAFSTTRVGGFSEGAYEGLNIGHHVGDAEEVVAQNRKILSSELPPQCSVAWLTQEHGAKVVAAAENPDAPCADGSWTEQVGVASAVMTADCLPVLFCSKNGGVVASAHAGWRGLNLGILESCVAALPVAGSTLMAWLGPAIGPNAFEVGEEVRQQFLSSSPQAMKSRVAQCFTATADRPGHFLADLYGLARLRLNQAGVMDIYGGEYCTFSDPDLFYSYRRDGQTGRMATLIAKSPVL
jgi:YfiH family protein